MAILSKIKLTTCLMFLIVVLWSFCVEAGGGVLVSSGGSWKELEPGLEYRRVVLERGGDKGSMEQVRFDLQRWKLALCRGEDYGVKTISLSEMRRRKEGVVAINGMFFDEKYKPLGYLQQNGRVLNDYICPAGGLLSGVFTVCNRQANLTYADDFYPFPCELAFQSGPRLVVNSQPNSGLRGERERLSGLAKDGRGRLILYCNDYSCPLTLRECAELLVRPENEGGVAPLWALNLDGGSSSGISIKTAGYRCEHPSLLSVPVGLVVKRR
ncbi:phosphodiester glycosidase family protein [bacterium]|nr:phosphodiester glycosidase family protein [bacterium]